jgi:hypothetical protein
MQKLLICATKDLATKLEEKLRYHYDVQLDILDSHDDKNGDNILRHSQYLKRRK